jgi:nitrate reductase beta subunit
MTNAVAQVNITGAKHSKVVYASNLNETLGEVTEKALKDVVFELSAVIRSLR